MFEVRTNSPAVHILQAWANDWWPVCLAAGKYVLFRRGAACCLSEEAEHFGGQKHHSSHHSIHGNPLWGPSFPTLQSGNNNSAFHLLLSQLWQLWANVITSASRALGGLEALLQEHECHRGFPTSALQRVIEIRRVHVICVGLPFAPLCAHLVHGAVAHALSTWLSPLIGLSLGFIDARQRGLVSKRKREERKACWALLAPRQGFCHACPVLINSSDVPETAAAELPVSCWRRGLGFTVFTKIIPKARPGTLFWWRKHICFHHPLCWHPNLAVRALGPQHLSPSAACDSPGQLNSAPQPVSTVPSPSPTPQDKQGSSRDLTVPKHEAGRSSPLSCRAYKGGGKALSLSPLLCLFKIHFLCGCISCSFLLYMRAPCVNLVGWFVSGMLRLGFFTTLLVPGSKTWILLQYLGDILGDDSSCHW